MAEGLLEPAPCSEVIEFGAQVPAVGQTQAIEDVQRLAVRHGRGGGVAGGLVGVAEMGERHALAVEVTEAPVRGQRLPVTDGRLAMVSLVQVHVAETVPGVGLTGVVPGAPVKLQGLPAERVSPREVTEERVDPADLVEGVRLPGQLVDGLVQGQTGLGMPERPWEVALRCSQTPRRSAASSAASQIPARPCHCPWR